MSRFERKAKRVVSERLGYGLSQAPDPEAYLAEVAREAELQAMMAPSLLITQPDWKTLGLMMGALSIYEQDKARQGQGLSLAESEQLADARELLEELAQQVPAGEEAQPA